MLAETERRVRIRRLLTETVSLLLVDALEQYTPTELLPMETAELVNSTRCVRMPNGMRAT